MLSNWRSPPRPGQKWPEQEVGRITGKTGKSTEDERVAVVGRQDGSLLCRQQSGARSAAASTLAAWLRCSRRWPRRRHQPRGGRRHQRPQQPCGATQDQVRFGVELPAVMQSGGWKTPAMVVRYTAKLDARRSGAAKLAMMQNRGHRDRRGRFLQCDSVADICQARTSREGSKLVVKSGDLSHNCCYEPMYK
jgi:hypothetical protein